MALIFGRVRQDSYDVQAEGREHNARMNPRGELIVPDWMTQLVMDGRVYNFSNAVMEGGARALIGEATDVANALTNPSILVDVPDGTTILPLEIQIGLEGTGTSPGDYDVQVSTDDGTHFSSGGATLTPINARKDDPNTSACTVYEGSTQIVTSANTDDNIIFVEHMDVSLQGAEKDVFWSARTHVTECLIGPASLLIHLIASNVDNEFLFHVKYAEFSTTDIT